MERILVILNREKTAREVLATAGLLAARLEAERISVLHPRLPEDPSFMPTEEVMTPERRRHFNEVNADRAVRLRRAYAEWQSSYPAGKEIHCLEVMGNPARSIGSEATQADLQVIGHVMADDRDDTHKGLHAAIFGTAPPVIVAPVQPPSSVGVRPAIAWQPGKGMETAVKGAMPLLRRAESVTILIGQERSRAPAEEPKALMQKLEQSHVKCDVVRFRSHGHEIGNALLAEAKEASADMIVMGAYTHPRFMERLLGGATEDLLHHADLPLLLHH